MIKLREQYYLIKKYLKHNNEINALYQEQYCKNVGKQIQLWNWWEDERTAYWLEQFIDNRGLLKNTDKTIALCSVFGEREVLERVEAEVKIFFSGENLHNPCYSQYADYMLSSATPFDFAMGFDEFENEKYLRFPLWLIYLFPPNATEMDIRKQCEEINHPTNTTRSRFCSLIARADTSGLRTHIYNRLSSFGKIDCPSVLFHNDDTLKEQYNDDKLKYLTNCLFNICPENSNASGYCTEKIFESLTAGCIPIYWGCNNMPEQKILNQDAIIFWDTETDGEKAILQIKELYANQKHLYSFMQQPRLSSNAEEEILRMMDELYNRLRIMLE